jgi:hypothetical protein
MKIIIDIAMKLMKALEFKVLIHEAISIQVNSGRTSQRKGNFRAISNWLIHIINKFTFFFFLVIIIKLPSKC